MKSVLLLTIGGALAGVLEVLRMYAQYGQIIQLVSPISMVGWVERAALEGGGAVFLVSFLGWALLGRLRPRKVRADGAAEAK